MKHVTRTINIKGTTYFSIRMRKKCHGCEIPKDVECQRVNCSNEVFKKLTPFRNFKNRAKQKLFK